MAAAAQYIRVSLRPKMLEKRRKKEKKEKTAMKKVKETGQKKIAKKVLHSITTII